MKRFTKFACLVVALMMAVGAYASERHFTSQPGTLVSSGGVVKASGDTVDLMGPGGLSLYRGDFEDAATARPSGIGLLPNGWYSEDPTGSANHWQISAFGNPYTGNAAWFGDMFTCGATTGGGYGNSWEGALEFRKFVGAGTTTTVTIEADIQFATEAAWDFFELRRRTPLNPNWEPVAVEVPGSESWDGVGAVSITQTLTYTPADLMNGTDISIGFVFTADSAVSDGDCQLPGAPANGGARVDNFRVKFNSVQVAFEDFEDGVLDPGFSFPPNAGVGDFARIWNLLGDADDCATNFTKLVAFIDDGIVVPGTNGTLCDPGFDYGPPGGYGVNTTGGVAPGKYLYNGVYSPVMDVVPGKEGMTFAFDVYRHELLSDVSPGIFYQWSIRSADALHDINEAPWVDRNFVYYGGPDYLRSAFEVSDLFVTGATKVQIALFVNEYGYNWGYDGNQATPAPYFDNVSLKIYPLVGPTMATEEIRLPNDGFPANGAIDLGTLGANSIRFDMAASIAPDPHLRNDPGDSIWIDATPRPGGVLVGVPEMYWAYARQNPLFDIYRVTPANPVLGTQVSLAQPKRYSFDLPDTGMLFPGDILHIYFKATDDVAGVVRSSTLPRNLTGYGTNTVPLGYSSFYTVNGLPSISDGAGTQPGLLFWNDEGIRGGEDEWYGTLAALGLDKGIDYDVFVTKGPSSGVGNGLGGRATSVQLAGYTDMLYTCGDLSANTISNGDYNVDPGNDVAVLNGWFAAGGRDMFLTGDSLAQGLATSGATPLAFLELKMGVEYTDGDLRDNINNQTAPLVVKEVGNPVFTTANNWIAYGGCFGINNFDNVKARAGASRLAAFTNEGGTPYADYSAATLKIDGTNRVVSMNHDLRYIVTPAKAPAPISARAVVLSNVLDYFGVVNDPGTISGTDLPVARFGVESYPNPFNPSLTIKYTLKNPGNVVMKVYNVRGELVKTLLNDQVSVADGSVVWDGTNDQGSSVSSGVYFVETRSGADVNVQKATMVK